MNRFIRPKTIPAQ